MKYAFDTSPLVHLFKYYYPKRFPTLWEKFDQMIANDEITSTREVFREISEREDTLHDWAKNNKDIFVVPNSAEAMFVSEIYKIAHFRDNIEKQKLYKGGKNADPFIIARAQVLNIPVVSNEIFKPNGVKIPNICDHFGIGCMNLEQFMEQENWQF